jgi:hypothetical protein
MATLLTSQAAKEHKNYSLVSSGTVSASLPTSPYFFYSNNPEKIESTNGLAEIGHWLNKAYVSGTVQAYVWHLNGCTTSINECLLVYNSNAFDIDIIVSKYGVSQLPTVQADYAAWQSYLKGTSMSKQTVLAGDWLTLFPKSITAGGCYGVVALMSITKKNTSTAAGVYLYDLAYKTKDDGAKGFADGTPFNPGEVVSKKRGYGKGFDVTISSATLTPTTEDGVYFKIGSESDSISGNDLVNIISDTTAYGGKLPGAYGEVYNVTIPIKNTTGAPCKFCVYIGSNGGYSSPIVKFENSYATYPLYSVASFKYVDVIRTKELINLETETVSFTTVIPAVTASPYVIGVGKCV